jgi:hypothetical protein
MTTTFELEHPRAIAGRFSDKSQSESEVFLLGEDSVHTVTTTREQNAAIAHMAAEVGIGDTFIRPLFAGRVAVVLIDITRDDYLFEATIDGDGRVEDVYVQEHGYGPGNETWKTATGADLMGESGASAARATYVDFATHPTLAQSAVITALSNDKFHQTSLSRSADGTIRVLTVATGGAEAIANKIVLSAVALDGTLTESESFSHDDDGEMAWRPLSRRAALTMFPAAAAA